MIGSLNHEVKGEFGDVESKQKKHSPSHCRGGSIPSISIAGRRREVPAALGEGSGGGIASASHQNIKR